MRVNITSPNPVLHSTQSRVLKNYVRNHGGTIQLTADDHDILWTIGNCGSPHEYEEIATELLPLLQKHGTLTLILETIDD